ncbi:noroxomaritidine synthase 2-like [Curcuma longa]|uniref:noroxomaritidine synthase 2-like n=1 Tax=Curcuma longa TaxID=136217 RepID=UPI003D9FA5E9
MAAAPWSLGALFGIILWDYPVIILALASSFFLLFLNRRRSSALPINWPFIGMLPALVVNFPHLNDYIVYLLRHGNCTEMFRGPWFLGADLLLTCDPDNVNHIFNANFDNYPKGDQFREVFDILGHSLFSVDGDSWKFQRKIAGALLGSRSFRVYAIGATREMAEKALIPLLLHKSECGEPMELQEIFIRLTFDVTCLMVFGDDPGSLSLQFPDISFSAALDDAWEALFFRHIVPKSWWKVMKWINVGTEKKMTDARKVIDQNISQRISQKRQEINAKISKADLLASYMEVAEGVKDKVEDTDKFLRDNVLFLMIAGRDAFSISLSWFFFLLHNNPKVKTKILQELRLCRSSENKSTTFSAEELSGMVYLHGAVCETLRIFPPVAFEEKTALKEDVLPSGAKVAAGQRVVVSVYAMARVEAVWGKDCMEFKPERWITEEGKVRHVPAYKFMAFNCGPRICLGKDLGLMQIKTVTAAVLWNFEVEVLDAARVEPKNSAMLRMKNGMMVTIKKRTHSIE